MLSKVRISVDADAAADVTELVQNAAKGTQQGICLVAVADPYAGIVVTDGCDPRRVADLLMDMDRAFPARGRYENGTPKQTAAAVKSAVFGAARSVPIETGRLKLGKKQRILAVSYGKARELELMIQIFC